MRRVALDPSGRSQAGFSFLRNDVCSLGCAVDPHRLAARPRVHHVDAVIESGPDAELAGFSLPCSIAFFTSAFGGARLALRGSGLGSLDEAVNLVYSGGELASTGG